MDQIIKSLVSQFFRFGVVGVFCTLLHYGLYLCLYRFIGENAAYILGYVFSFIANFFLTSYFTFHSLPSWRKFVGMLGAHGINMILHLILLNLFLWIGLSNKWAPIPVFVIAVPINFILVRYVFRSK
jgi:putative flippase GtrA